MCDKYITESVDMSKLGRGSMLIVRTKNVLSRDEIKGFHRTIPKGTVIWNATKGETLEMLSEEDMNRAGWYRK